MKDLIRVMVVDDISSIREKYINIFEKVDNIEIVATASDGYDAVLKTATCSPDIILMDIEMEDKYSGITATKRIIKEFPDIKIIILTVYDDDDLIFTAFQAGVCDYIQKTASAAAVIKSVTDAYYGRSPIRPQIANRIRGEFKRIRDYESSLLYTIYLVQLLTDSERKILILLRNGRSQREICQEQYIEPSTLKTHIRNIKNKFKCNTIQDVIRQLEESGFYDCIDQINKKNRLL